LEAFPNLQTIRLEVEEDFQPIQQVWLQ
jgi:hypothetical protein